MGLTFFKRRAHSKKASSSKTPASDPGPALTPHGKSISKPIPIPSRPITAPTSSAPLLAITTDSQRAQTTTVGVGALVAQQTLAQERLRYSKARVAQQSGAHHVPPSSPKDAAVMDDLSWIMLPESAYRAGTRVFAPQDMFYSQENGGAFEVRRDAGTGGYTLWSDPGTMAQLEGEGVPVSESDFDASDYAASEAEICVVDNVVTMASEGAIVVDIPKSGPQTQETPFLPELPGRPASLVYDPRGFFVCYPATTSSTVRK